VASASPATSSTNADFIDRNVLLYVFDEVDSRKQSIATELVDHPLRYRRGIISFQVVQEVLNVLTRKLGASTTDTQHYLEDVLVPMWEVGPSQDLYREALRIHGRFGYAFYDAQIIAAAASRGCKRLQSEYLHNGHELAGVQIVNPFAGDATS